MGQLLTAFTYPRNAFAASADKSAVKMLSLLTRVDHRQFLRNPQGKVKDEAFFDGKQFLAIAGGTFNDAFVTPVGERFRELAKHSEVGAWRWLLTRSMWLYSVPNGSAAGCNDEAAALGIRFNFFDMIVRLTTHLGALPAPGNILYFDELLVVLNDDDAWQLPPEELFRLVLTARASLALTDAGQHAELLSELEPRYNVGRDVLNTVFRKALGQCGLFQITGIGNQVLGIRLDPATYSNPVLAERLRFVLDNPRIYRPQETS